MREEGETGYAESLGTSWGTETDMDPQVSVLPCSQEHLHQRVLTG